MIRARTFVYDKQLDCVVELLDGTILAPSFGTLHDRTKEEYRTGRNEQNGSALRQITLERAERREFAHTKFGDERRWKE